MVEITNRYKSKFGGYAYFGFETKESNGIYILETGMRNSGGEIIYLIDTAKLRYFESAEKEIKRNNLQKIKSESSKIPKYIENRFINLIKNSV